MHHIPVIVERTELFVESAPDTRRDHRPIRTASAHGRRRRGVTVLPVLGAAIPLLLALGIGGAARQTTAMRRRRRAGMLTGLGVGTALALGGVLRWQMARWFTPASGYTVEGRRDGIEIRRYPAMVVAETTVAGLAFEDALAEGFRRLVGYIGGDNAARELMPMSVPVAVRQSRGHALSSHVDETSRRDEVAYTISFVMPEARAGATLPLPDDARVRLEEAPERRVAVLRGTGGHGAASLQKKADELVERVRTAGLVPTGKPSVMLFDSPTTLPFLRRVEASVEVV